MTGIIIYDHNVSTAIIWLGLLIAAGVALFSVWRYLEKNAGTLVLTALRALFLALLAWCLFQPSLKESLTKLRKPQFLVVLDTSKSMLQPRPAAGAPPATDRWTAATRVLDAPWLEKLDADCDLYVHTFAQELSTPVKAAEARAKAPDGNATLLRETLRQLGERYRGQDVKGCVLLTDGIDTAEARDSWASEAWPWPIYTARLTVETAQEAEPDLRVDTVQTPRRVSVGWKTDLKAVVGGQGTRNQPVNIQLFNNGKLEQETPASVADDGSSTEVSFSLSHPQVGVFTYRVFAPPLKGETHTNDNAYSISVQVVDDKNRLLYVEGPPSWNSKYLTRALRANPRVTPVTFVRGPNNTFLTTGPAGNLTPDMTDAQLALFKIVIVGNLDATELGRARAENLVKFVDAGGSLVLLGGVKGWGHGGFVDTPLKQLLPMSAYDGKPLEGDAKAVLTDAGLGHPAFAGDPALWANLPPVLSLFPNATPMAAAQTLVAADGQSGRHPIILVRPYGQGKVVAILTDSLWRWQLTGEGLEVKPYQRFWNQLLAWLFPAEQQAEGGQVDVFVDRDEIYMGDTIEIGARVGGDKDVNEKLSMKCEVTTPDQRRLPFVMTHRSVVTPSGRSFPGFGLSFAANSPGMYTAKAATEVDGKSRASEPVSFFVKPFTPESAPRPVNVKALQTLALQSRGRYFETPAALEKHLETLQFEGIPEERVEYRSLWQRLALISCLLGLLAIEWTVRKWRNMP